MLTTVVSYLDVLMQQRVDSAHSQQDGQHRPKGEGSTHTVVHLGQLHDVETFRFKSGHQLLVHFLHVLRHDGRNHMAQLVGFYLVDKFVGISPLTDLVVVVVLAY